MSHKIAKAWDSSLNISDVRLKNKLMLYQNSIKHIIIRDFSLTVEMTVSYNLIV